MNPGGCPPAVPEACCTPALDCLDIDPCQCNRFGNAPQGTGTDCTEEPCFDTWVCCCTNGSCHDVITAEGAVPECDDFCGEGLTETSIPGVTCASNPCPEGNQACCYSDGQCADVTPTVCTAGGGIPQGAGTDCATLNPPCPQPTGACCIPPIGGSCQDLDAAACAAAGGGFQGTGTSCATITCPPLPPPLGACCNNVTGGCANTSEQECILSGPEFTWLGAGTNCGPPNPCPVPCDPCSLQHVTPLTSDYRMEWNLLDLEDEFPPGAVCSIHCSDGSILMEMQGLGSWASSATFTMPPEFQCNNWDDDLNATGGLGCDGVSLGGCSESGISAALECVETSPLPGNPEAWHIRASFNLYTHVVQDCCEVSSCGGAINVDYYKEITDMCESPVGSYTQIQENPSFPVGCLPGCTLPFVFVSEVP